MVEYGKYSNDLYELQVTAPGVLLTVVAGGREGRGEEVGRRGGGGEGAVQEAVQTPCCPGPSLYSQAPTSAWPAPPYMTNSQGPEDGLIPDLTAHS